MRRPRSRGDRSVRGVRTAACYPPPTVDLDLSPEHLLLRDTIRGVMDREVAPVIDRHERERRFPREIVDRIGEMGWLGIPIPHEEGGAGLDTLAYAIAIE